MKRTQPYKPIQQESVKLVKVFFHSFGMHTSEYRTIKLHIVVGIIVISIIIKSIRHHHDTRYDIPSIQFSHLLYYAINTNQNAFPFLTKRVIFDLHGRINTHLPTTNKDQIVEP